MPWQRPTHQLVAWIQPLGTDLRIPIPLANRQEGTIKKKKNALVSLREWCWCWVCAVIKHPGKGIHWELLATCGFHYSTQDYFGNWSILHCGWLWEDINPALRVRYSHWYNRSVLLYDIVKGNQTSPEWKDGESLVFLIPSLHSFFSSLPQRSSGVPGFTVEWTEICHELPLH